MYRDLSLREKDLICRALDRDADLQTSQLVSLRTLQEMMRERDNDHSIELTKHLEAALGVNTGIINAQRNLSFMIRRYKIRIHSPLILLEQA